MCRMLFRKYKCCDEQREVGILPCDWSHRTQPWTPCPEPAPEVRWDPDRKCCDAHASLESVIDLPGMKGRGKAMTLAEPRHTSKAAGGKRGAGKKKVEEQKEREKGGVLGRRIEKTKKPRKSRAKPKNTQEVIES